MVKVAANAFTIANGCPFNEGRIPIAEGILVARDEKNRPILTFGDRYVRLGTNATDVPILSSNGTRLLRARREKAEGNGPSALVYAWGNFFGILVRIESPGLVFGFEPYVNHLNLWAGGDGDIHPMITSNGQNTKTDRQQLYQLDEKKSIFIADSRGAVTRLTCMNGVPHFTCVDIPALVEFHLSRARSLQNRVRALDWAWHNLRMLKDGGHSFPVVDDAILEVQRLRERSR